jgi:hypothetical protein
MCRTSHKISTNLKQREGDLEDKESWHKKGLERRYQMSCSRKKLAHQQQRRSSRRIEGR